IPFFLHYHPAMGKDDPTLIGLALPRNALPFATNFPAHSSTSFPPAHTSSLEDFFFLLAPVGLQAS
ncbi:hypothetical protein H0H81_002725, partial [Sphagnurus paluster]